MPQKSLATEQLLNMLKAGPERISAATAGLSPAQLQTPPAPGEWSANEVLAHLRACSDMWGQAIETILTRDKPTFRAVNPRTWLKETDYLDQDFKRSLRAFTRQRNVLLSTLEPLSPQDWSRYATVTVAGKPLQRTVLFYAEWLATHERPHLKQIEHIANTLRNRP